MTEARFVDLWVLDLQENPAAGTLRRWADCLSLAERARAARYRQQERRVQSIAGRALLRHALSFRKGGNPAAWEIDTGENGRPCLTQIDHALDFNVSHTDGLAVCAVSNGSAIGIDVEHKKRAAQMAGVEKKFLCDDERKVWLAKLGTGADTFLARLWTLKEAWAKATGLGLQADLTSVCFDIDAAGKISSLSDPDWQFHSSILESGHVVSVACRCSGRVRFQLRSGEALLEPGGLRSGSSD